MKKVTASAARRITGDLDKLASTLEKHFARLGIPEKVAKDFSYRCDLLSDRIAKVAGFDPSTIAKPVPGPLVKEPDEKFMDGHFTQREKEQLLAKQEAGKLSDGVADPPVDGTQVSKTAQELAQVAARLASLLSRKAGEDKAPEAKPEEKPEEKKAGEEPKPEEKKGEEKPEDKTAGKKGEDEPDGDEYDLDE